MHRLIGLLLGSSMLLLLCSCASSIESTTEAGTGKPIEATFPAQEPDDAGYIKDGAYKPSVANLLMTGMSRSFPDSKPYSYTTKISIGGTEAEKGDWINKSHLSLRFESEFSSGIPTGANCLVKTTGTLYPSLLFGNLTDPVATHPEYAFIMRIGGEEFPERPEEKLYFVYCIAISPVDWNSKDGNFIYGTQYLYIHPLHNSFLRDGKEKAFFTGDQGAWVKLSVRMPLK